jgi:sterol 3beta-glucosyltransferase
MRITILTVGSRGDIQPYVALGIGFKAAGHQVRIATERNYQELVTQRGLEFAPLPGNRQEWLGQDDWYDMLETQSGNIFSASREATAKLTLPMLPEQLAASWAACQDTDAIISMPWVFGSYHIAEKLRLPFFCAWTTPSSRTRDFPHGYMKIPPQRWLGGWLNWGSYLLSEWLFWKSVGQPLNRWRVEVLKLPPIHPRRDRNLTQRIPMLYAFSPSVIPKPADWTDWVNPTGYWTLDRDRHWQPSPAVVDFIKAGTPPIYVGFGSMTDRDPTAITRLIVEAIVLTGQRAIIDAGWAGLGDLELPPQILGISSEDGPHDWLLPQMAAIVHHGGAGTTGASLRAGKPTVVVYPPFTDYYFWGHRLAQLGVGPQPIAKEKLTAERLAKAIDRMLTSSTMQQRAAQLGEQIRAEDGVQAAVAAFHRHLPASRRLTHAESSENQGIPCESQS